MAGDNEFALAPMQLKLRNDLRMFFQWAGYLATDTADGNWAEVLKDCDLARYALDDIEQHAMQEQQYRRESNAALKDLAGSAGARVPTLQIGVPRADRGDRNPEQ